MNDNVEKKLYKPLKFKTPKILQEKIDNYFNSCHKKLTKKEIDEGQIVGELIRPYTITGLALSLDTSRETLLNYAKREKYFDSIKRARLKCQNFAEEKLYGNTQCTGAIFNLKNNYGWKDKQEHSFDGENIPEIKITFKNSND